MASFLDISGLKRFLERLNGAFVSLSAQTLTDEQKKQVKENLGISDSDESGEDGGDSSAGGDYYTKEEVDALIAAQSQALQDYKDEVETALGELITENGGTLPTD
jgi:hypothetical protein